MTRKPIPKKRKTPRRGRILNPAFLMFVRSFACVVCANGKLFSAADGESYARGIFQESPTEAAHVGKRGLGQKCDDIESLPLCGEEHHRLGPRSAHVLGRSFWSHHILDRDKLVAELQPRFVEETGQQLIPEQHRGIIN